MLISTCGDATNLQNTGPLALYLRRKKYDGGQLGRLFSPLRDEVPAMISFQLRLAVYYAIVQKVIDVR